MTKKGWKGNAALIRLFQDVGRASLIVDLQDSHSGNMAVRFTDEDGAERIAITATGSQKGDLEPSQVCFLSPDATDYGYYKASSETDVHAGILAQEGVRATFHAHTKELVIATLDDSDKPNLPPAFRPIDPLGFYHLGGEVPVDWLAVPSGSREMTQRVRERMSDHRATIVQGHGTFSKGRTLQEAFFLAAIADRSGYLVRLCRTLGVDVEKLRLKIAADLGACFQHRPAEYTVDDDHLCDFPGETEILKEFRKAGARIFESRLSPFHTGSISVRGVRTMLYAPKASMPRELGGPLLEVPLADDFPGTSAAQPGLAAAGPSDKALPANDTGLTERSANGAPPIRAGLIPPDQTGRRPDAFSGSRENDDPDLRIHRQIYARSDFQTVMHCYVAEAEAISHFVYPGEPEPVERVVPVDAEGGFLYLVIPVVTPKTGAAELVKLLHQYKVVIVRGGGVWAVGHQSISEALHHPSSVREICLYRIGAFERGLDLRKMEPKKAKNW